MRKIAGNGPAEPFQYSGFQGCGRQWGSNFYVLLLGHNPCPPPDLDARHTVPSGCHTARSKNVTAPQSSCALELGISGMSARPHHMNRGKNPLEPSD
jgi:hypothetical protein